MTHLAEKVSELVGHVGAKPCTAEHPCDGYLIHTDRSGTDQVPIRGLTGRGGGGLASRPMTKSKVVCCNWGVRMVVSLLLASLSRPCLSLPAAQPPENQTDPVALVVQAVGPKGDLVTSRRYVAILGEASRWSTPVDERISEPGAEGPSFKLPPGKYRAFCAADGLASDLSQAIELAAGGKGELVCQHGALVPVSGVVVSARDGGPVAGARVGVARALAGGTAYKVTPLAEPLVIRPLWTTTDRSGRFELRLPVAGRSALWVEAEGFAPLYRPNVGLGESLAPLRLEIGGGSLEVRIRRDPGECDGCAVELLPGGALRPAGYQALPPYLLRLELDENGFARWPTLPDGFYSVGLRRAGEAGGSRMIAQVWVGGGRTERIERRLKTSRVQDVKRPANGVRVTISNPQTPPEEMSVAVWEAGVATGITVAWSEGLDGLEAELQDVCGVGRFLTVSDSKGRVAAVASQDLCTEAVGAPLQLFPAGELSGFVQVPADHRLPTWGWLHVGACAPRAGAVRLATVPFAITGDGKWKALIPSGCIEVTLAAQGFAPSKLSQRTLVSGEAAAVGLVVLTPGGSITARLVDGKDGSAVAGARVGVVAEDEAKAAVRDSFARPEAHWNEGEASDAQGWVRLPAVPIGRHVLRVSRRGRLPIFTGTVEVEPGSEVVLDPLEIPVPASLRVRVKSGQETTTSSLSVLAVAEEGAAGPYGGGALKAALDRSGVAEFAELPPGVWQIRVVVGAGKGAASLAQERILVQPGELSDVELEVQSFTFKGQVVRRGQPVSGMLELRPVSPTHPTGQSVRCEIDEEGRFVVSVAELGRYLALVSGAGGPQWQAGTVDLADPSGELLIRVPSGSIRGIVVDGSDMPAPRARIDAYLPTAVEDGSPNAAVWVSATAGADGVFVLDSLQPGRWDVTAKLGRSLSDRLDVTVPAEGDVAGLRLMINQVQLRLMLRDSGGNPVAGEGTCIVPSASPSHLPMPLRYPWTAGADGVVDLVLGVQDAQLAASVGAVLAGRRHGGAWFAVRQLLRDGVIVTLPEHVGGMTLLVSETLWQTRAYLDLALVRPDGAFIPMRLLTSRGHLRSLTHHSAGTQVFPIPIGPISAGDWAVVLPRTLGDLYMLSLGQGPTLGALDRAVVSPGVTVELMAEEAPHDPEGVEP